MAESSPVTLITGCSSGFGFLIAKTLAQAGHHVYASMRNAGGRNQPVAAELEGWAKDQGLSIRVPDLDVTDDASVAAAVDRVITEAGRIDVVVSNAGVGAMGVLESFSIKQLQGLLDLNALGPVRLAKAVLPGMRAQRSGLFLCVSSTMGRVVLPTGNGYAASKFALEAFMEALRNQLTVFNIDVAVIEPGGFPTGARTRTVTGEGADVQAAYDAVKPPPQARRPSTPSDPQEIADAALNLIQMPAGRRPFRTVVGSSFTAGVEKLNEAYERQRGELWGSLGYQT